MRQATSRLLSQLGICKKAGKLVQGFDPVREAAQKKALFLILTTRDFSAKSQKEMNFTAGKMNIELLAAPVLMDEVAKATGKRCGVLGIMDRGLADSVTKLVHRANEEE